MEKLKELLDWAEDMLADACRSDDVMDCRYWCGYIDAVKRMMEVQNNA